MRYPPPSFMGLRGAGIALPAAVQHLAALQGCLEVDAGNRDAPIGRVWPGVVCREARVGEGRGEGEGEISAPPPPLPMAREVHTFPLPAAERCPNGAASRAVAGEDRNFPLPAAAQCLSVGAPWWRSPPPPTGQGEVVAGEEWGEGPPPTPSALQKQWGTSAPPPPGGDHNFPLPEMRDPKGGKFRSKVGYGGYFKPRGGGGSPCPCQLRTTARARSSSGGGRGTAATRPPPRWSQRARRRALACGQPGVGRSAPHAGMSGQPRKDGAMGGHGVADSPRAGHKGALQGLSLWPAQGGGAKRRGPASSRPPLTGASSGMPGNPTRRARAPRRRLHGRASSEVT